MKTGVLIATGFGVLLAAVLVGFVGLRQVIDAVASIGWWGFAALCPRPIRKQPLPFSAMNSSSEAGL